MRRYHGKDSNPRAMGRNLLRHFLGSLVCVSTQEKVAALTFDDGPHPEVTPMLLTLLKSYRARATFFMVGRAALANKDLVQHVAAAGHEVASHSFSHVDLTAVSMRRQFLEVRRADEALVPLGGSLFRPPQGRLDLRTRLVLRLAGKRTVMWSLSPSDWQEAHYANILDRMTSRLAPGSIVLLHDRPFSEQGSSSGSSVPMLAALDRFLRSYSTDYEFVSVTELVRRGRPLYQW